MTGQKRLAVLASGRGSNLAAIADACASGAIPAQLALVLCNVEGAGALTLARERGIPARCIPHQGFDSRDAFDDALLAELRSSRIEFVALAGFMRILTERFIREYYGSLLNIHPSLLPKYPGLETHRRAIEAGDRETGATVHFVIPALDAGPAILHGRVTVLAEDTPETLADRVRGVEHRIYPQALAWCLDGQVVLRDSRASKDGETIGEGGIDIDCVESQLGSTQADRGDRDGASGSG